MLTPELITDVDLSRPVDTSTGQQLLDRLLTNQILLFRGQSLDADTHAAVAGHFGSLRPARQQPHYPLDHDNVYAIANVDRNGHPIGSHPDINTEFWHTDGSWADQPAAATVLHAVAVPASGSTTLFVDAYGLLDNLPAEQVRRLVGMRARHDVELSRATRRTQWPWQWRPADGLTDLLERGRWFRRQAQRVRNGEEAEHSVIRPHPQTGRDTFYLGDHAWRIVGQPWPIGVRSVHRLNDLIETHGPTYVHEWREGDVLVWDNASLLHRVDPYPVESEARVMQRCVVAKYHDFRRP